MIAIAANEIISSVEPTHSFRVVLVPAGVLDDAAATTASYLEPKRST